MLWCTILHRQLSVLFLSLLIANLIFGQNDQERPLPPYYYSHRVYTALDGLSQTNTSRVHQDEDGFIWVATREGINKFDGLNFENYLNNPNLPDDFIKWIDVRNDTVVFAGQQSVYRYVEGEVVDLLPDSVQNIRSHIYIAI